jgi:hypothetical protein
MNVKDESKVNKCHREVIAPDDLPPDYMGLLSLLAGLIALFMKSKISSWCAVFLWLNSVATAKTSEMDWKNTFISFIFSLASLAINYFGPQQAALAAN